MQNPAVELEPEGLDLAGSPPELSLNRREAMLLWVIGGVFGLLMIGLLLRMICSEVSIQRSLMKPGQSSALTTPEPADLPVAETAAAR